MHPQLTAGIFADYPHCGPAALRRLIFCSIAAVLVAVASSAPAQVRKGVDYSFGRPNLKILHDPGYLYDFVIRYVGSSDQRKNITKDEADSIKRAGLDVVIVFENSATRMRAGYTAGADGLTPKAGQVKSVVLPVVV
jgi:hypothetical protein